MRARQTPRDLAFQDWILAGLRSPLGALVAQPWFDRVALRSLTRWFFPLSRLWAAARSAEGSVERYLDDVPMNRSARLERELEGRLRRFESIRAQVVDIERAWEDAFFGNGGGVDQGPEGRAEIERVRLVNRNVYNAQRRLFAPFRAHGRAAPFRWSVPTPAEVAAVYDDLVADPTRAFAAPDPMPDIAVSRPLAAGHGRRDFWLRFASPSPRMNEEVIARVHEPAGVADPPTLIFGHGICVEFDHWRGLVDEVGTLVTMGFRVIRPEAPWHGRRVPPGSYGGERFVATTPFGALDLFTAAAREWAVLIDWCRRAGAGPVAIGGSSLGALTAQVVADKARYWPERLRPDAMLLITHCGRIEDAAVHGSLARSWGIVEHTVKRGWTRELMGRYMPLLNPVGEPVIPPARIVTVLGRRDDVTPFESARTLIGDWRLPRENAFIWRRGHFSVPLTMLRDHSPLRRFRKILNRLA